MNISKDKFDAVVRDVINAEADLSILRRENEELRAALRELHEAASETEKWVFSYRDYAGKWRNKLRDAIAKARAAVESADE